MFPFINPTPFIITLSTLTGVLFHDTSLDKISNAIIGLPALYVSYDGAGQSGSLLSSDPHIHIERAAGGTPSLQTRLSEDKKYRLNRTIRGQHPFDDYSLPLV